MSNGGEGGIRTRDGLMAHTPLAGERLRPLGHLSNWVLNEGGKDTFQSAGGKALIRPNLYFLQ